MELLLYCPLWGMDDLLLEIALQKIKDAGYHGAEIALNPKTMDLVAIKSMFEELDLRMIAQHPFAAGGSPKAYLADYISSLERMVEIGPDKINCHTGKDYFSFNDNKKVIEAAHKMAVKHNIIVTHEIHRGTFSFSPTVISDYLNLFSEMKLTADFSHWCVVSESLLENHGETMDSTIPHCVHIHARVGSGESPQVTHPGAPEYELELKRHTEWWKSIFDKQLKKGTKEFSVTCEFGPAPYMPSLPFTNLPVASQWGVNLFMKDYFVEKFKEWQVEGN